MIELNPDFRAGISGVGNFTPMKPDTKMTPDIPSDRNPANMGRSGSSYRQQESVKAVTKTRAPVIKVIDPKQHQVALASSTPVINEQAGDKETREQRKTRLALEMMARLKDASIIGRTKAGIINLAYESISEARSSGLSLEELTEKINEAGVKISKKVLADALYRIRGRKESKAESIPRTEPLTPEEIMVDQASARLESMKRASKGLAEIIDKMSRSVRAATNIKSAAIKEGDHRVILLRNLVGTGILSGEVKDAIESLLEEVCN